MINNLLAFQLHLYKILISLGWSKQLFHFLIQTWATHWQPTRVPTGLVPFSCKNQLMVNIISLPAFRRLSQLFNVGGALQSANVLPSCGRVKNCNTFYWTRNLPYSRITSLWSIWTGQNSQTARFKIGSQNSPNSSSPVNTSKGPRMSLLTGSAVKTTAKSCHLPRIKPPENFGVSKVADFWFIYRLGVSKPFRRIIWCSKS